MHQIEYFYKLIIKASLTPSQVANPLGSYTRAVGFGTIQFYAGPFANVATLLAALFIVTLAGLHAPLKREG
jgi:hypothetical protein